MTRFLSLFIFTLIGLLGYLFIGLFSPAYAQLKYPIPDLGYCRDAKECYLYCEIPKNSPTCWSYGKFKLEQRVLAETAESPEEKARRHGITFPITELGGCRNVNECMNYCQSPANHQTCMDFAREKGLYEEPPPQEHQVDKGRLLEAASRELGCSSESSCRNFCENPANHDRCMAFARNQDLPQTSQAALDKRELLQNATSELGCNSMESCRSFCENPANHEKCMEFGRQHGFDGEEGQHQQGSFQGGSQKPGGGCDSEESCRRYCQENPAECQGYGGQQGQTGGTPDGYLGPTGCKTEEECKSFCQANPSQCPGFPKPQPTYSIQPPESYPTYYPQPTYSEQPQSYPTYSPQPTYPQPSP